MLPYMNSKSIMRPSVQTGFGGLNHNKSAGDGEIYDMLLMSSREYPLLATRPRRGWIKDIGDPLGSGSGDKEWYANDTVFNYNGATKGTVSKTQKQYAVMGKKIIIMPDKKYYDTETDTFGTLGVRVALIGGVDFQNGVYMEVPAEANTIYRSGANWASSFSEGDAVTISGCTVHPENNGSFIIREIDGDYLHFYENTFTLDSLWKFTAPQEGVPAGTYYFYIGSDSYYFTLSADMSEGDTLTWTGTALTAVIGGVSSTISVTAGTSGDILVFADIPQNYSETGDMVMTREIPDMDFICVNENRLWGCKGDSIYASSLGDPFNFNVFDGLSSDSWAADATDSAGDFTGCISYMGYPVFFKEDSIYTIQGDNAKNFAWTPRNRWGVKKGCERSLAVAGETLFYLSRVGVCAYTGGTPVIISAPLGVNAKLSDGVAGSDGVKYYISLYNGEEDAYFVYAYDTRYGVWHKEDEGRANCFYFLDGALYSVMYYPLPTSTGTGRVWCIGGSKGALWSDPEYWNVTFADSDRFYETTDTNSQNKKGPLRILIRAQLNNGTKADVKIRYDDGTTHTVGTITGSLSEKKKTYIIPLVLRRCDHYRLSLDGYGDAVIYSISIEKYSGSQYQGSSGVTLPNGELNMR